METGRLVNRASDKLLSRFCCYGTRGNGFKLKEGRFRLDIRQKFSTMRVVKPWTILPRGVGDAPSLGTSQARLDGALSNPIWLQMSLVPAGGGVGEMASKGPFQLNYSMSIMDWQTLTYPVTPPIAGLSGIVWV